MGGITHHANGRQQPFSDSTTRRFRGKTVALVDTGVVGTRPVPFGRKHAVTAGGISRGRGHFCAAGDVRRRRGPDSGPPTRRLSPTGRERTPTRRKSPSRSAAQPSCRSSAEQCQVSTSQALTQRPI